MKTSLFTALLATSTLPVWGQGMIYFNNRVPGVVVAPIYGPVPTMETVSLQGNGPSAGVPATDPFPLGTTDYLGAARLSGTAYTAELWSFSGGLWDAVPGSQRAFRTAAAAGFVEIPGAGADVSIPSVLPGDTATLEVRAWVSLTGTADPVDTWAEALLRGVDRGASATFTAVLGGSTGGGPSLPTPNMENLRSFSLAVPEPQTGLLTALGLLVLVLRRTR